MHFLIMNWPQFHFAAQTQGQGSVQYVTHVKELVCRFQSLNLYTTNLTDTDEHNSPINFN